MRFSATSLALLGITLVSASSSADGPGVVPRSEHNNVERDLLERAAASNKIVKINRRSAHGPRRQDTQHMKKALVPLITNLNLGGKPVVLTDGEIRIAERPNEILAVDLDADVLPTGHQATSPPTTPPTPPSPPPAPVAQPNIPINVNAALLGKPLAQVDAVVNLGLKNLGLGLKKKDILPVIANVDLLGKPLVVVDGLVEVLEKPHELLAVDLDADVLPTGAPASAPAPPATPPTPTPDYTIPIKVDADLRDQPLLDVNGGIDLNDLKNALDLDVDVSLLGLHRREKRAEVPAEQSILADVDISVGSANAHRKVGGLTLAALKARTEALSAVINAHLADDHDDCSLNDVNEALSALISGIHHDVFRRML